MSQRPTYPVAAHSPLRQVAVSQLIAGLTATALVFTGTGSLAVPAPAFAATGSLEFAGTGSLAVAQPTLAATGAVEFAGSAALAVPQPSLAGSGVLTFSATGALPVPAPSIASTGTLVVAPEAVVHRAISAHHPKPRNVVSQVVDAFTPSAAISGSAALTANATLSGAGSISGVAGLPDLVQAGTTGQVRRAVQVQQYEYPLPVSGVTWSLFADAFTGTAALTVSAPPVASAGTLRFTGTGALLVSAPSLASSGLLTFTGVASVAVPAPSISGSGTTVEGFTGTATVAVVGPLVSGVGTFTAAVDLERPRFIPLSVWLAHPTRARGFRR